MNRYTLHALRAALVLALLATNVLPPVSGRSSPHGDNFESPAPPPQQPKFHLDCTLPALTSTPRPIDKTCGNIGSSAPDSNSAMQNEIKNRFCLPDAPTAPVEINFDTFDKLQKAAQDKGIHFGRKCVAADCKETFEDLPSDRSALADMDVVVHGQHLGEGTLVTLEGFVFKAQHSNTFVFKRGSGQPGESVNCNMPQLAANDIHIALIATAAGAKKALAKKNPNQPDPECATVTAEITPHHRSTTYNRFDTNPADFLKSGTKQKKGQDKLTSRRLPLQGARVRITGQLFFDASHTPCKNGHGGPPRRSIWEVHPVFEIQVFDTTQKQFVPFEEWAQNH
jgi:hypothetical protein